MARRRGEQLWKPEGALIVHTDVHSVENKSRMAINTHLLTLRNGVRAWGTDVLTIRMDVLSVVEGTGLHRCQGNA